MRARFLVDSLHVMIRDKTDHAKKEIGCGYAELQSQDQTAVDRRCFRSAGRGFRAAAVEHSGVACAGGGFLGGRLFRGFAARLGAVDLT